MHTTVLLLGEVLALWAHGLSGGDDCDSQRFQKKRACKRGVMQKIRIVL
jgi:hypothetical protein